MSLTVIRRLLELYTDIKFICIFFIGIFSLVYDVMVFSWYSFIYITLKDNTTLALPLTKTIKESERTLVIILNYSYSFNFTDEVTKKTSRNNPTGLCAFLRRNNKKTPHTHTQHNTDHYQELTQPSLTASYFMSLFFIPMRVWWSRRKSSEQCKETYLPTHILRLSLFSELVWRN